MKVISHRSDGRADLVRECRRLIQSWRDDANVLGSAFECDNYARIIRCQASELEKLLPKRKKKKP